MKSIQKELKNVTDIISDLIPSDILNGELSSFVLGSSKRIRSILGILYIKAYGCELSDNMYRTLAATEILHNASLLHDDVIDDAELRRGNPTLEKNFNSKVSILAGDFLMSVASKLLIDINNPRIINSYLGCIKNMCCAELRQYFLRGRVPLIDDYIEICKNKTGTLFSVTLESVALLSDLNLNKSGTFGELFGIYFQIKNDLEASSASIDKKNCIYTARDILGIEKAKVLSDNYKEELIIYISSLPKNIYMVKLKSLIESL